MLYGAILGDMIGSRFEFDRGGKTKDFELLTRESTFTDDTVMTIALAHGLLLSHGWSPEKIKKCIVAVMRVWGRYFPNAGYGQMFYQWLFGKDPMPYNSFGNGSAMRVSAVGWLFKSVKKTRQVARLTAEISHNHPEGIKGAECTASVIYLARTGHSKEYIKKYVTKEFGYDISKTVDELRPLHEHIETCQDSMPKALVSFFEGTSFEDVVRNAVSLGGDTDTLGAIAGSMAEAFYGVPEELQQECRNRLPNEMTRIIRGFEDYCNTEVINRIGK